MQIIEKKLCEFCRNSQKLELRLEYTNRAEQIERMSESDYDLIFADSGQLKLMLHCSAIRKKLQPLQNIPGLHLIPEEYAPAAIKAASDQYGTLYGLPLTAGPDLQLINRSSPIADELLQLNNFYDSWFRQLTKLQQNRQPLLILPLDYRYLEPIFRSYGVKMFDEDLQTTNLATPQCREIIQMLEYYLHNQQLGMLVSAQRNMLDIIQDNVLKSSPIALRMGSTIFLKPASSCMSFAVKPPPQARQKATWLFWEGVLAGSCCDRTLAGDVLNFLQSASVQSLLPGCTALPARLDMQKLALAAYEPEFPGITEAYQTGLQHADNPYALPYDALNELNLYLRTVICGLQTVSSSIKDAAKKINSILQKSAYIK